MSRFELAEVGRLGQAVNPLQGGDVDPRTGRLLSVAEIRDILARRNQPEMALDDTRPAEITALGGRSARQIRPSRRRTRRDHIPTVDPVPAPIPGEAPPDAATSGEGVPPAGVWVIGVSGGCGESTVAAILPNAIAGQRQWPPTRPGAAAPVLMVARGSMASLAAAQRAAAEWANGNVPGVRLLGLLIVADAPGAEPRPVTDLIRLLSGGLPQIWRLPWVRDWRLVNPQDMPLPRPAAAVTHAITDLYR